MPDGHGGVELSVQQAIDSIRNVAGDFRPDAMLCLGSGLSDAGEIARTHLSISYDHIPGLAAPSAPGHPGRLAIGSWGGKEVLMFLGRLHWYEGHSWDRITLPVRIAAALGASACVLANASGAVNPTIQPGSLVLVADHMNLMGTNPLVGAEVNDPSMQFPDMGQAYSERLRNILREAAKGRGIDLCEGVYAAVSGPNYETPAEVRALKLLGADVVGMSTVGEVLVARQSGLECCAISCVTNRAAGMPGQKLHHSEVVSVARASAALLSSLLDDLFHRM